MNPNTLKNIQATIRAACATLKNDFRKITITPSVLLLLFVQTIIFAPSIFLMNDVGLSFIGSVAADHGSMLASMITILEPKHLYDQLAGYHSSYYGWTYFAFSFLILAPIKFLGWILGANTFLCVFVGLKVLHFFYGCFATVSLYFLARKFLDNSFATIVALLLIVAAPLFRLNYMFHPENIGVFLSNLGMIYLYDFVSAKTVSQANVRRDYYITLFFLVLSTLAKPTFFMLTFPLALILINSNRIKKKQLIISGDFAKDLGTSLLFSFILFFFINPWVFFRPGLAIKRQIENIAFQSQSKLAFHSAYASFVQWTEMLTHRPIIVYSVFSIFFLACVLCFVKRSDKFLTRNIVFLFFTVLAGIAYTMTAMRTFIMPEYLIPFMGVSLICAVVFTKVVLQQFGIRARSAALVALVALLAISSSEIENNYDSIRDFYAYRTTIQYKIYRYIAETVPDGASIAHDQVVPIPDDKNIRDYHFWQHSAAEIESVKPDYIIYDSLNKFNGLYQDQTLVLMHMTQTEPYDKVTTFGDGASDIGVWKRKAD